MTPLDVQSSSLGRMGSAQQAIDEYQSSTSGRSASRQDSDGDSEGPAALSGLYMGQSAPLRGKDVEEVSIQHLVAETPMLQLKKAKLGKSANKAEVYRLQR